MDLGLYGFQILHGGSIWRLGFNFDGILSVSSNLSTCKYRTTSILDPRIGYFGIPEAALSKAVSSICLPFDVLWASSSKAKPHLRSSISISSKPILLHSTGKPEDAMKNVFRVAERQCDTPNTMLKSMCKHRGNSAGDKNKYNQCFHCRGISEIKLKRTDTTLFWVVSKGHRGNGGMTN